jgi:hypothetical protein
MSGLRQWMRDEGVYDKDLEEILASFGIVDPEADFANITEDQWDEIFRLATVERFKELKDQQSRDRLEKKIFKIEKAWRQQSGLKKSNIKKHADDEEKKPEKNAAAEQAKLMGAAMDLKKAMQKEGVFDKDLYQVLVEDGYKDEEDLKKIKQVDFDEINRRVRVLRAEEIKDPNAKLRLEQVMVKWEKYWRRLSGVKNTNIKKGGGDAAPAKKKELAPKEEENEVLEANKQLKEWMRTNEVWEKDLFNALVARGVKSEDDLKGIDETSMDDILRTVRVERFSELKDQASRQRLEKLLMNFEKEWRKVSGIKKTNIKKAAN